MVIQMREFDSPHSEDAQLLRVPLEIYGPIETRRNREVFAPLLSIEDLFSTGAGFFRDGPW